MSRLTASRAAFDLIASFEGFRTRAALAPDGQWTLGFGHVATAREGLTVTRTEAEDLLRWDLLPIEDMIRQAALTPLSQNQFDALVSFAYNIGIENFRTSDVLKFLNQGQPVAAALSMHAWRRAPVNGRVITIDALVRRRAAESALFLETVGARPAAPSSVIRPQIDQTATLLSHAPDGAKSDVEHDEAAHTPVPAPVLPDPVAPDPVLEEIEPDANPIDPVPSNSPLEADTPAPILPVIATAPGLPVVTIAEAVKVETLSQGPVVLPPMPIPQLADLVDTQPKAAPTQRPLSNKGPMVPDGLSPFPGSPDYTPANGIGDEVAAPANDGLKTRLYNTPQEIETPVQAATSPNKPVIDANSGPSALVWGMIALGAALLAFGLFFSWQSGILTVTTPRREPTTNELLALLAAASGLIIFVTSAVSALTGNRDEA